MIMDLLKIIIFYTILCFCNNLHSKEKVLLYTLEDLTILKKQKNYFEFLNHALDIRPSKRNKNWEKMVQDMATGFISGAIEKKQISKDYFMFIEKLLSWPSLKNDEFFIIKRNQYGHKYIEECFKETEKTNICQKFLLDFWYNHKDPELGLKLGKIIQKQNLNLETWQFYEIATKSPFSTFFCKDKNLKTALFKKTIELFNKNIIEEKKEVALLKKLAHSNCWKTFLPTLKKSLYSNQQIHREQAFKILDLKKSLSQIERDTFLTFYILKGPLIGKTFNQAWNTVRDLGQSFARRIKVIENLDRMDPLPDDIFALATPIKKKTLIKFMYKNMPEYFSLYAKTCLNYLKGKKFKAGNPTFYCKEFFQISENNPWPSLRAKNEYKNLVLKLKKGS